MLLKCKNVSCLIYGWKKYSNKISFVNYGLSENIGQLKMPLTDGKIKNGFATNKKYPNELLY